MFDDLPAGTRVQRFEVICHLGTGGMGSVFRARDPSLERDVALKLVARRPETADELSETKTIDLRSGAPATPDDLLREARMMARLSHPNVLPVYEVGLVEGALFVVMEHIDGCDLRTWLRKPRTSEEIISVFMQAGYGLAAAHARDIVHRDFKPENVLVGLDGRVRVADFGLSRIALGTPRKAMRRVENPQGTPRYMASELWRGEQATPLSDVYAFCVALLEAFGALRGFAIEPSLCEASLPESIRDILIAGTAENPRARPELDDVLNALAGTSPSRGRSLGTLITAASLTLGAVAAVVLLLLEA